MQANLDGQKANCETWDVERCVALDAEFHILFCDFLGNQKVLRVMGQLRERMHRVSSQVFKLSADRVTGSYVEHCGIADAVIQGDGLLAARPVRGCAPGRSKTAKPPAFGG